MRNFLVFESQKLWFNIPGRENTMRNKSLIHTKDVKTQEGTPLHLEYYLLNGAGAKSTVAYRYNARRNGNLFNTAATE